MIHLLDLAIKVGQRPSLICGRVNGIVLIHLEIMNLVIMVPSLSPYALWTSNIYVKLVLGFEDGCDDLVALGPPNYPASKSNAATTTTAAIAIASWQLSTIRSR